MSLIQKLHNRCKGINATIDDWIILIEAVYVNEPEKIPLLLELFRLSVKSGYSFSDAFDLCRDKYLEGLKRQLEKNKPFSSR